MNYIKKYENQSNQYYNDGLNKAQIHDLSGAIVSLRKSLKQNRNNTKARNLLGLVHYGRGEMAEALAEWIISKNLDPQDPQSEYFISTIQQEADQLERINQSIKRFNTVLRSLDPSNFDIAIVQLRQAVDNHPYFLKAWQLLALIYIQTSQLKEAKDALKIARKLDTTDEITLRYIHEIIGKRKKHSRLPQMSRRATVEYREGNTKIIQPRAEIFLELSQHLQLINITIGLLIGASLIWFLVAPAVNQSRQDRVNAQQIEFSQRISSMEAQISAQTRQLDEFRAQEVVTEGNTQQGAGMQESYEALLIARSQLDSGNFTFETIVDTLLPISTNMLGEQGTAMYESLVNAVFPTVLQRRFDEGMANFDVLNYTSAITNLGRVVQMDPSFQEGVALLRLGLSYKATNQTEQATTHLQDVVRLFPNTDQATQAQAALDEIRNAPVTTGDQAVDPNAGTETDTGTADTGTAN